MAHAALSSLSRGASHHEGFAFGQTSDRNVGRKGRARVAGFKAKKIVGNLYNAILEGLAFAALIRGPEQASDVGLRRSLAFDHLDPLAWSQRGEVARRRFGFSIGSRFCKTDHQRRRRAPGNSAAACAALVVGDLLDDVALWKTGQIRIFRTAGPNCAMTEPA